MLISDDEWIYGIPLLCMNASLAISFTRPEALSKFAEQNLTEPSLDLIYTGSPTIPAAERRRARVMNRSQPTQLQIPPQKREDIASKMPLTKIIIYTCNSMFLMLFPYDIYFDGNSMLIP